MTDQAAYAPPAGWTRLRLTLAWDGTDYAGWQEQPHAPSVQGSLYAAALSLGLEAARPVAAGRTDAGVHAEAMPAHLDLLAPHIGADQLARALNSRLPRSVAVLSAEPAPAGFHARFSCTERRYVYRILCAPVRMPLWERQAWHVSTDLDPAQMNQAAAHLLGTHDFAAFATREDRQTVRELRELQVSVQALPYGELLEIRVAGESFLRHMVRGLVGTLVLAGQGRLLASEVSTILRSGQRAQAGANAPAQGLCFTGASYLPRP
ncbi:tRNA pseudouridine(38-40) synthase TruA [Deinococcus lacus]|uniref:tRNA pseudouridine synthase A n=1 Tax=Deinococcus lacus TaxID=392561 RepID=A0ABW1YCG7_9DEIO